MPRKRGPRGPHKIQGEVTGIPQGAALPGEPMRARELAKLVQKSSASMSIQERSSERSVEKKLPMTRSRPTTAPATIHRRHAVRERCARPCLAKRCRPSARSGLIVFLHRGMWGWARARCRRTRSVCRAEPSPILGRLAQFTSARSRRSSPRRMAMAINDRSTP